MRTPLGVGSGPLALLAHKADVFSIYSCSEDSSVCVCLQGIQGDIVFRNP